MRATHISGIKNTRADALSRLERAGDYEVRAEELLEILKIAQRTPTLDAFAASHNHKLERWCGINSPIAEDGLMVPWKGEVVLAHPPVPLIVSTIQKAKREKAQVILLLPNWRDLNWDTLLKSIPHRSWDRKLQKEG
ncbi:uncharacterized protein MONOS_12824 [Monocercomonoides exilis]|uniref:uncharacterized protein n=1 Tax=Monocercomonoides exilis TaxID=2049356 RepID=UPI00355A396B|nr:hypothetical protein MONOS_12824 [Monocercomonoides exilis]|eukprot:MONOS_12824.1-p1 / transcript=MONOS_12824.1 / gene=MONOS_12824 / organism=Monocercomonoides_exilis_PA203 / gene_product=unspecified product / transcript_product=unspecified product / location=Mono_scaffold00739:5244-5654(-) / protein_length=137 / sequence_SO=supercontig / SO=protein_coding / is_pseudo=false